MRRVCRRDAYRAKSVPVHSLEYAQLLTQGKDFDAEVVSGTKKSAKAGEETKG